MSRRAYVDANNFVVGPPGQDCLAAAESDLLFSSRGGNYNGVFMAGIAASGSFSETHSGVVYTRTCTINFGKSFPAPPRCIVGVIDRRVSPPAFLPDLFFSTFTSGSQQGGLRGEILQMQTGIFVDHLDIVIVNAQYTTSVYDRHVDCPYLIFDR